MARRGQYTCQSKDVVRSWSNSPFPTSKPSPIELGPLVIGWEEDAIARDMSLPTKL